MTTEELLLLQKLIAKWRKSQNLTHAQRNWLEEMSIAISDKLLFRIVDDVEKLIPF